MPNLVLVGAKKHKKYEGYDDLVGFLKEKRERFQYAVVSWLILSFCCCCWI